MNEKHFGLAAASCQNGQIGDAGRRSMMQQRSGFGIWRFGLVALVAALPALLAEPGLGEETYGVEVLPGRAASAAPVDAGDAPESRAQSTQERLVLVFDVPITNIAVEPQVPPPDVNAPPWEDNDSAGIRVHGEGDTGPSRIRAHSGESNDASRIRVHSRSGGTP
jgi:hypothetical protein